MTSQEIRKSFLDFFKSKGHTIVNSSPVVPFEDPTLLFANAGMNQFKDVFLGTGNRNYKRAADTQKCIRVSGKHNDLEEVGYDTYHHTFFEMLGNWSFGDYYKAEAIQWAWELLTDVWKIPKERLWVTVYRTDDEALNFWKTKTDINHNHILRFDEKDNFWEMGETGPCGPCSEIHVNLSDDFDNPKYVNAGVPECLEIWNLVFIQYNRGADGLLNELPARHVDTGMGFERVCKILQNKESNYDTDVFSPLIERISKLSNVKYEAENDKIPMRVIADHIRTLSFAIADGAVPGNEGRGYVLRRILRRAARYGRKLNLKEPFLFRLVDDLAKTMGDVFPEIVEKKDYVKKIIKSEEEHFNKTLDRGIELFDNISKELENKKEKIIKGEDVFKLYDTFGFPFDLTNVMAREIGFSVDEAGYNKLMEEAKTKSREATKEKFASVNVTMNNLDSFALINDNETEFTGYDELNSVTKIVGIKKDVSNDLIILDRTPFYVEAGGQVDDIGKLRFNDSEFTVIDLLKFENKIIHIVESETLLVKGAEIKAEVDAKYRWDVMRNHSVTHFLHATLRNVLGTHVQQAGSYVGSEYLRFDFSHFQKLTHEEIFDIESIVNEQLRRNLPKIHHKNIPFDEAKKMGAIMFFGDKYGDKVNVVQFGDYTMEFCGGTHVNNSSEIGLFKILSEASIASGIRRIEATTGIGVEKYLITQLEKYKHLDKKVNELQDEKKKIEKELSELKLKEKLNIIPKILAQKISTNNIDIYKSRVEAESMDELKLFGDELRNRIKSGVGLLVSIIDGKVGLVCVVTDDLIKEKKFSAGKIVNEAALIVDGKGGGRPHLATAGGKDISKIDELLRNFSVI
ncbi:MAG: alanine--tRNA ligase [Chlorobiaceae bacterium]|nr:alanine--tRNA ligase [Chlorobiaceae bacterium]MBA4309075.1 alanine--tRNA ligase [Chlorobiaceae bacterium]